LVFIECDRYYPKFKVIENGAYLIFNEV